MLYYRHNIHHSDEMKGKSHRARGCAWCKATLSQPARGRRLSYCSASCRQRAYEERRRQKLENSPVRLLARDINTARVRGLIQTMLVAELKRIGLIDASPPSAPKPKPLSKAKLVLVPKSEPPEASSSQPE